MTKLLRLRQITSSPALLDSDAPSIKEETIIEMVREAAERGEKSVIFSVYVEEVERLVKALKKLNPAKVIGTMASKKAFDEVQRLQEDPSCMALVGSLLACKESYDMFAAKNVFFLDLSYNWDQNEQAVSRVWRRGQHEQVNIYYLYCEGTVDEAVFEILIRDKRLAQQLVGLEGESVRTFDPDLIERMLRLPSDKEYTPLGDEKIGAD
jgi:SNF2 family DNA or RNA helicase